MGPLARTATRVSQGRNARPAHPRTLSDVPECQELSYIGSQWGRGKRTQYVDALLGVVVDGAEVVFGVQTEEGRGSRPIPEPPRTTNPEDHKMPRPRRPIPLGPNPTVRARQEVREAVVSALADAIEESKPGDGRRIAETAWDQIESKHGTRTKREVASVALYVEIRLDFDLGPEDADAELFGQVLSGPTARGSGRTGCARSSKPCRRPSRKRCARSTPAQGSNSYGSSILSGREKDFTLTCTW